MLGRSVGKRGRETQGRQELYFMEMAGRIPIADILRTPSYALIA